MTRPSGRTRADQRLAALDRHWLRSTGFTLTLVGLVATAVAADWTATVALLVTCAVGFGFFYLLFPGGAHFGMTVANLLAIYGCTFEFFRDANFPEASREVAVTAVTLPVLGFLAGAFVRRRQVFAIVQARRIRQLERLPRLTGWLLGVLGVGAASFALPRFALNGAQQGMALLGAATLITALVVRSVRDVILLMIDVAMVFEGVAARLDRLVRPLMAFLTFYGLLVVVFACLYRIADLTAASPQFTLNGAAVRISFVDSLYYSIATVTTLGYGDIAPASLLVRAISAIEVVSGILMLLFGFSEINSSAGDEKEGPRRPR